MHSWARTLDAVEAAAGARAVATAIVAPQGERVPACTIRRVSVGERVRSILGPAFPVAGNAYRRVFVDVRKVAAAIPDLGQDAVLLDVGGGDGAILNPLLDRQPTVNVVAVDLAPSIGSMVRPDLLDRVDLHPGTSVLELGTGSERPYTAAFLSDVLHHVPPTEREQLLRDVLAVLEGDSRMLIVKDIIPQGARSALAFWADRNISGDRGVQAISPAELVDLVRVVWPEAHVARTALADVDFPNYCLVFTDRPPGTSQRP